MPSTEVTLEGAAVARVGGAPALAAGAAGARTAGFAGAVVCGAAKAAVESSRAISRFETIAFLTWFLFVSAHAGDHRGRLSPDQSSVWKGDAGSPSRLYSDASGLFCQAYLTAIGFGTAA